MRKDLAVNRIAEVRKRRGLTQQALADKLGVHWVTISKLERGVMQVTLEWLVKLASALDVPTREFYGEEEAKVVTVEFLVHAGGKVELLKEPFNVTLSLSTPGHEGTFWCSVATDEMSPFFVRHDLVRIDVIEKRRGPENAPLKGRLCLVRGDNGIELAQFLSLADDDAALVKSLDGKRFVVDEENVVGFFAGYAPAWDTDLESRSG